MKLLFQSFIGAAFLMAFFCSCHSSGPHPITNETNLLINNMPKEFDVTFSGFVRHVVVSRPLDFQNYKKVKFAIISANSDMSGSLIIQLYKIDDSMPFTKTYSLSGNFTMEETVALDFVPAKIVLDFPDYSASGFQFQIQAVD